MTTKLGETEKNDMKYLILLAMHARRYSRRCTHVSCKGKSPELQEEKCRIQIIPKYGNTYIINMRNIHIPY